MTYLALVQDDEWTLSKDDLVQALRESWPTINVDVSSGDDPARDVAWSYGLGESRIEGSAHESGQCIYLEGQERPVAEFVAWYRRLVPSELTVILCDDTYSFDAVVEPGSTVDQIQNLFPG